MPTSFRHGGLRKALALGAVLALALTVSTPFVQPRLARAAGPGYTYTIFLQAAAQNVGSNGNIAPNSPVGVNGHICPNPIIGMGEGIGGNVTYVRPDATSFTDTNIDVTSSNFDYCGGGAEGSDYVDGFTTTMQGTWHVYAYAWWQWSNGTEVVLQSNELTFNVGPPGMDWTTYIYVGIAAAVLAVAVVGGLLYSRSRQAGTKLPPPPPPPSS